ncbi:hypothetical protein CRN74_18660 [Yersinia frederiksenii]|nr:hypothetical protein CRN74_18660 [Yersinia frederiksenii]
MAGYSAPAAAKSVVGFSSLRQNRAHNRVGGYYVRVQLRLRKINGGLDGGIARCAGFSVDRSANPVQSTTQRD